jgi:putative ATPase
VALGALEIAARAGAASPSRSAETALQRRAIRYDSAADQHFDYASAWIKATRGSDPDASLYYLAIMLEGGEDPRFIARRMVILASEDIGNASPLALVVATATAAAVEHVGMPEAQHALAQCAIYLALAPKSNAAYRAIVAAREHVRRTRGQAAAAAPALALPGRRRLRLPPRPARPRVGAGAHAREVAGTRFYEPDEAEQELVERLEAIRRARAASGVPDRPSPEPPKFGS